MFSDDTVITQRRPALNGHRLRSPEGTIYLIDEGLKRPIKDLNTLRRLFDGSSENDLNTDTITTGKEIDDDQLLIKGNTSDTYYMTDKNELGHFIIRPISGAAFTKYGFSKAVNVIPQLLIQQFKAENRFE